MPPIFSIIIPGYNRVEPLKYTLRSTVEAAARLPEGAVEIILVDDGSVPPLSEQLSDFDPGHPVLHLRQSNQGSIASRLAGLAIAQGDYVLFLDSDDLICPEKLTQHGETARREIADVSYDDMAIATLHSDWTIQYRPGSQLPECSDPAVFFLRIQPVPHNPIYRRTYLQRSLQSLIVPADRSFDASGDVWLYYNLAVHPAKIAKVKAALTAVGPHEENRYSSHWEELCLASLRLSEAFFKNCPPTSATLPARITAGESAFESWRRLPYDLDPRISARILNLWKRAPKRRDARLGGKKFSALARWVSPVIAGRILKRFSGKTYAACRTMSEDQLHKLLS